MKIALFAPSLRGHRGYWLKHILATSSDRQVQVFVYTVKSQDDTALLNDLGLIFENLVTDNCPEKLIARWRADVEKDKILGVCWEADRILHKFLFTSGRYRLLIMRPYLEGKNLFGIARYLVKKFLTAALSFNKSIEVAQLSIPYAHKKSSYFHWVRDDINTEHFLDSIHTAETPKELFSMTKNHEIISVLGHLESRKNPVQAYRIVEQLRIKENKQIFLLFAGVQSQSFKLKLLKIDNMKNVIQIDRVLTNNEFKGVIKISKVILLPYTNYGASGLVLNSLAIGTPILLTGGRNWRGLQNIMGGAIRVEKRNLEKLANSLNALQTLPQQSKVEILSQEPISSVSSFLMGI